MPVYDTPITTDADGLPRILKADLPVMLYLYRGQSQAAVDDALRRVAEENAGDLLVARLDVNENPSIHADYDNLALPALVTLDEGIMESSAGNIRPGDIDAHADFLMGRGPYPQETVAEAAAKQASGAAPMHTSEANFQRDVLESDIPVLVDFWAPWCGPCHAVAPVLDTLAEQYAGQIKVAKLNVDENPQAAGTYGAMSIPLLVMFRDGQPVNRLVGAQPQPNIDAMIQQVL